MKQMVALLSLVLAAHLVVGQVAFETIVSMTGADEALEIGKDITIENDNTVLIAAGGYYNTGSWAWFRKMDFAGNTIFTKFDFTSNFGSGVRIDLFPDSSYLFGYEMSSPAFINVKFRSYSSTGSTQFSNVLFPLDSAYLGRQHKLYDMRILDNNTYLSTIRNDPQEFNDPFNYVALVENNDQIAFQYADTTTSWGFVRTVAVNNTYMVMKNGFRNGNYCFGVDVLDNTGQFLDSLSYDIGSPAPGQSDVLIDDTLYQAGFKYFNDTARLVIIKLNTATMTAHSILIDSTRILYPTSMKQLENDLFVVGYNQISLSDNSKRSGFMVISTFGSVLYDKYIDQVFNEPGFDNRLINDIEYSQGTLHFVGQSFRANPWRQRVYYARIGLSQILGTKELDPPSAVLGAFPNPGADLVTLSPLYSDDADLTVFNSLGQQILNLKLAGVPKVTLNVSHFSRGIYNAMVRSSNGRTRSTSLLIE